MPSPANVALLIQTSVYIAINNVRQNVLDVKANIPGTNADVFQRSTTVLANGTFSFTGVAAGNSGTVIKCSKPLLAEITTNNGVLAIMVNSMMVLTDEILSIVFSNPSSTDISQLLILQA